MDVHAPRNPAGYWPPGFRERAEAQAAAIVERDNAPTQLEQITALFPDAVEAAAKALGMAHVPDWVLVVARDALAACVASVTVTTEGTVTVVDHRTGGKP
jgi:hypothetical protein